MADVKFSEFPEAEVPLDGTEYVVGLQQRSTESGESNVKMTVDDIATYVLSQDSEASGGGDVTSASNLTADALVRGDDGAKGVQTSGILVTDDDEISGYAANVKRVTASSYTLLAADSGKILELSDGTGVALTLPDDLPKGWNATVVQFGAGAISFDIESNASLLNRQSHTESAGQNAVCALYVSSNSGGQDAEYVLGGDTA